MEEHHDVENALSMGHSLAEYHARWCNLTSIQMLEPKLHRRIQSLLSALRDLEQQRSQTETQLQFDIRQLQVEKQYMREQLEAVKQDVSSLTAKNAELHSTLAALKEEVRHVGLCNLTEGRLARRDTLLLNAERAVSPSSRDLGGPVHLHARPVAPGAPA